MSSQPPISELVSSALACLKDNRSVEAEKLLSEALKRDAGDVNVLHLAGAAALMRSRFEQAITFLEAAHAIDGNNSSIENNLGLAYFKTGQHPRALEFFDRALKLKPDYVEAAYHAGMCRRAMGDLEGAIVAYRAALKVKPKFASAWSNLGNVYIDKNQPAAAVALFEKALGFEPDLPEALNGLAHARTDLLDYEAAEAACRRAITVRPTMSEAHNNLGLILQNQGRIPEALASYRRALEAKPGSIAARDNLLFCLNYDPATDLQTLYETSRALCPPLDSTPPGGPESDRNLAAGDRLRVGYVSADFRRHSCGYFLEALLANHDRRRFEIFAYADDRRSDDITERLKPMVDHWRSLIGLTDKAVAALVRNDRIDVLVDLAGHTAGNRLSAFAEKPAPIQLSWLGYPATTGISAIDYRFTDDIADPPGATERFHTETLWRLSGGFLCYTAPRETPPVSPSPCGTGQPLTFGSFNNLAKVNRAVLEAWAGLLSAVAGSRLLLKSKALRSADVQQRVWEVFAGRGIARERIILEGWAEGLAAHLALYGKVDIALDTFPYNGTTTTFEALWMGVPVICLAGDRHSARVGASILTRCGLSNFIAASLDDYRAKATALARDPPALGDMRQALRPRVASSPLCDGKAFAAQIEDAYRTFVARAAAAS